MTDEEVICEFMEPHKVALHGGARSAGGWWTRFVINCGTDAYDRTCGPWVPSLAVWNPRHQLGALHDVEERLTDEQWHVYDAQFSIRTVGKGDLIAMKIYLHATAADKIKALAAVLLAQQVQP